MQQVLKLIIKTWTKTISNDAICTAWNLLKVQQAINRENHDNSRISWQKINNPKANSIRLTEIQMCMFCFCSCSHGLITSFKNGICKTSVESKINFLQKCHVFTPCKKFNHFRYKIRLMIFLWWPMMSHALGVLVVLGWCKVSDVFKG